MCVTLTYRFFSYIYILVCLIAFYSLYSFIHFYSRLNLLTLLNYMVVFFIKALFLHAPKTCFVIYSVHLINNCLFLYFFHIRYNILWHASQLIVSAPIPFSIDLFVSWMLTLRECRYWTLDRVWFERQWISTSRSRNWTLHLQGRPTQIQTS